MTVSIRGIAYALPDRAVTNEQLQEENPDWDMRRIEARAGVRRRYVAADDQTAIDLATDACRNLFAMHPDLPEKLDAILFCTETADHIVPPNSCILHGRLGLPERVFSLDVDLGCSGYPYCLAVARGLIHTKMATNVLVVNADTYSKFIPNHDQSTRVLFGDGAAASWISACDPSEGILDIACGTAGEHYKKFIIPAGGCRLPRPVAGEADGDASSNGKPLDAIHMDGIGILSFVGAKIPSHVRSLLERNHKTPADVDLYVFHQASRSALDSLTQLLRLRQDQIFSNLAEIGNTVSASVPIALKDAWDAGRVLAGQTIVLCGFGLGLSWASALLRWPSNGE